MTAARKLSQEAVLAINAPETAENFLWLLTITHENLGTVHSATAAPSRMQSLLSWSVEYNYNATRNEIT